MQEQFEGEFADETREVIGALVEVHRLLGPGLLEAVYEECLCRELRLRRMRYERQVPLAVAYKGHPIACAYRLDLVVEHTVLIELKAIDALLPVHQAQTLTYLKLSNLPVALLVNMNVPRLRMGLRRLTPQHPSTPREAPHVHPQR